MNDDRFTPEVLALLDQGPYLTIHEAAERFGLNEETVRGLVAVGRIPARRLPIEQIPSATWDAFTRFARANARQRGWVYVVTAAVITWYLDDRHQGKRR